MKTRIFKKYELKTKLVSILILLCFQVAFSQVSSSTNSNTVQKAHKTKLSIEDFETSDKGNYYVSVFSIEKAFTNTSHHWFLQVLTSTYDYVNYGRIDLVEGHLKSDPSIKFNFMNPVVSLCNEGKYIIGFVNVKTAGVYELLLEIENFDKKDKILVEIEISDNDKSK